jgi:hypothetical protein
MIKITIKNSRRAVRLGVLTLAMVGWVTLTGCQKKQAAPQSTSQPSASDPAPASETVAAQPEAAVPVAAPAPISAPAPDMPRPINGVVAPFLTTQLRIFIQEKGRFPESFAEFAGARLDSVPRLAPGLKFAIDPATQEVKIVSK